PPAADTSAAGRRSWWHRWIGRQSRPTAARAALAPAAWSLGRLGRFRLGRALIESAVEDVLGDAVLQHLDRAAGDHPAAAAPHAIFNERRFAVARRAHDLHRLVRDLEAGLVAGGLCDRRLVGRG